jgi:RND superfamily putative drug exporter
VESHPDASLSLVTIRLAGDPYSKPGLDAVSRLRSQYVPDAFNGVSGTVLVGGGTAEVLDFNQTTDTYTPLIFVFVLGLSFLLLMVAFRSVVVPVTSIIMNLLSVSAAYGLLVLVFQKGVGAGLLGFQRVETIEPWLPLFLFSVLFGLSMDYHVFLLSRMREHFNQTGNSHESVAFGLQSTGRLITGAALIMVAVFGGFAMGELVMMQEMGFGLATAVFMDATIVRTILVPATMRLLGRWNWYFPKWLSWVPRIGIGENGPEAAHEALRPRSATPAAMPVQTSDRRGNG